MSQNGKPSPVSPPKFSDSNKQTWTINLTLGLIDRIQAEESVDLIAEEGDASALIALLFDHRKLARVLWACVSTQAESKQITREDFVNSLDGETLSAGWGALVDSIVFFIPSQRRPAVQAAIDAQMAALEQGVAAMAEVAASQETNQAVREAILKLRDDMQAELPKALAGSVTS